MPAPGAYVDQRKFKDEEGKPIWPPKDKYPNGFDGPTETKTLQQGEVVDRFRGDTGSYPDPDRGRFLSPAGESFESRALSSSSFDNAYSQYEVAKPFDVTSGKAAPWFGEAGGGTQYFTGGQNVQQLIDGGYLVPKGP